MHQESHRFIHLSFVVQDYNFPLWRGHVLHLSGPLIEWVGSHCECFSCRGDHTASYEKVTLSDLNRLEAGNGGVEESEEEDTETTTLPSVKNSTT